MNRQENDVLLLNKLQVFQDFLLFSVQLTISISPRQFHLGTRLRLTHFTHILFWVTYETM